MTVHGHQQERARGRNPVAGSTRFDRMTLLAQMELLMPDGQLFAVVFPHQEHRRSIGTGRVEIVGKGRHTAAVRSRAGRIAEAELETGIGILEHQQRHVALTDSGCRPTGDLLRRIHQARHGEFIGKASYT